MEASASQRSAGRGAGHTTSQKVQTPPRAAATRGAGDSLSCPIPTAVGSGMLHPLEGTRRPHPSTAGLFLLWRSLGPEHPLSGTDPPPSSLSMALRAAAHRSPGLSTSSAGRCHWCVRVCLFAAQACVCVCACFSVGSLQFCCLSAPSALDSSPLHGFVSLPVLQQLVSFSPRFALQRQLWSQGLCLRTPVHVNNMQHNSASYRSVH